MTITERPFAAQLMTDKGRTHSFDAIECMMRFTNSNFESDQLVRLYRVADQQSPHDLFDATTATYVVSESIPSPMGGNLSAYKSHDAAAMRLGADQGDILTWKELVELYKSK
jgi:copper chaperone NosL